MSSLHYSWTHIHLHGNGRKKQRWWCNMEEMFLLVKKWRRRMPSSASHLLQPALMSHHKAIWDASEACPHLKESLLRVCSSKIPPFSWYGWTAEQSAAFVWSSLLQWAQRGGGECSRWRCRRGPSLILSPGPIKHVQPEFKKAGTKSTGEREWEKWRKMELKS